MLVRLREREKRANEFQILHFISCHVYSVAGTNAPAVITDGEKMELREKICEEEQGEKKKENKNSLLVHCILQSSEILQILS